MHALVLMKNLLFLAILFALLGASGCHSGEGSCVQGSLCECSDGTDCYQGCADGNGCDLSCHNMVHCGGVCGDSCNLQCHDVNDCSSSCGDNCQIDCHNTVSCGAFCGANCQYDCQSVGRCGVRAGPGSTIACTSVTTCCGYVPWHLPGFLHRRQRLQRDLPAWGVPHLLRQRSCGVRFLVRQRSTAPMKSARFSCSGSRRTRRRVRRHPGPRPAALRPLRPGARPPGHPRRAHAHRL
jgi:hypothetical protein